jgi:hypothetical protein
MDGLTITYLLIPVPRLTPPLFFNVAAFFGGVSSEKLTRGSTNRYTGSVASFFKLALSSTPAVRVAADKDASFSWDVDLGEDDGAEDDGFAATPFTTARSPAFSSAVETPAADMESSVLAELRPDTRERRAVVVVAVVVVPANFALVTSSAASVVATAAAETLDSFWLTFFSDTTRENTVVCVSFTRVVVVVVSSKHPPPFLNGSASAGAVETADSFWWEGICDTGDDADDDDDGIERTSSAVFALALLPSEGLAAAMEEEEEEEEEEEGPTFPNAGLRTVSGSASSLSRTLQLFDGSLVVFVVACCACRCRCRCRLPFVWLMAESSLTTTPAPFCNLLIFE